MELGDESERRLHLARFDERWYDSPTFVSGGRGYLRRGRSPKPSLYQPRHLRPRLSPP